MVYNKDTLDKHVRSAGHKKFKETLLKEPPQVQQGLKRQSTIGATVAKQKKAKSDKQNFIEDTVKMWLQANIPINKLDHPSVRNYLNKYVCGAGDLPMGNTLRKDYVPACGQAIREEIKEEMKDKDIVIIADETTDSRSRCVFAILFRTINPADKQIIYLASVNFLDTANGSTCSQAIIDTIKDYGIEYKNVLGLVSDSARYMGTCFKALKTILGQNILHYQCWAHKVNLVGDVFLSKLPEVNHLVAKIKSSFLLSRKMKSTYLRFLRENYPELPTILFPTPVITRWNSWFRSVEYLDKYLDCIVDFFKQNVNDFNNSSIMLILDMFKDQNTAFLLKIQVKFVTKICSRIAILITTLEGSDYPFAHCLWEELESLSENLKGYLEMFPQEIEELLVSIKNVNTCKKIKLQLKECIEGCQTKLPIHMATGPTNDSFQATNALFNPIIAGQ